MQKQLQELLSKEMTRQEFLASIGLGLASVMGLSGVLKLMSGKSTSNNSNHHAYGYGRSSYGGGFER